LACKIKKYFYRIFDFKFTGFTLTLALSRGARVSFPMMDNSFVGDGVLAKHAESTRRRRPESACKKIKIILPMICFHICAIFPHPDRLPQGDEILNQNIFSDDI